ASKRRRDASPARSLHFVRALLAWWERAHEQSTRRAARTRREMVLVDSHVHVHPCFDLARVLDTAAENFRRHALGAGCDGHYQAVLCLTETASADCFFRMREA